MAPLIQEKESNELNRAKFRQIYKCQAISDAVLLIISLVVYILIFAR